MSAAASEERRPERLHRVLDPAVDGRAPAPEDLERALDEAHRDGWDLVGSVEGYFSARGRGSRSSPTRRTLLVLRRSPDRGPEGGRRRVERVPTGATVAEVVRLSAEAFGVRAVDVLARPFMKTRQVTRARHVAAYVLRSTGLSYPEVGTALAHMDHTSAMSACRRVERSPLLLAVALTLVPEGAGARPEGRGEEE